MTSRFNSLISRLQRTNYAGGGKGCNFLSLHLSNVTNYNCSLFNYFSNKHFKSAVGLIKTQKVPLQRRWQTSESNYVLRESNISEKVTNQISNGSREQLLKGQVLTGVLFLPDPKNKTVRSDGWQIGRSSDFCMVRRCKAIKWILSSIYRFCAEHNIFRRSLIPTLWIQLHHFASFLEELVCCCTASRGLE